MTRRPAREPEPGPRELTPLAAYRAERVTLTVTEVTPWPGPGPEVTPLEMYGAVVTEDLSGMWVYAFADPGPEGRPLSGRVWYAGQVGVGLWSRWRDHYYRFGQRFTDAVKWRIRVANEAEADLIELALIHFYQPECNDKGRAGDLAAKVRRWGRGTRDFDQDVRARTAGNGPSPKRTGRGIT